MTTEITPTLRNGGYLGLWRTVPRELFYLIIAFPVSVVGFGLTIGLFSAGLGTIVTFFIGVILIIACLYIARGFGTVDLTLLELSGRPAIARPEWQDARARTGFFGWLRAVLGNGHYWLYLLHVMIIDFIVQTVTWTLTVVWLAVGFGGISHWFWDLYFPADSSDFVLSQWLWPNIANPRLVENLLALAVGLVFVATLPLVTRGLVTVHWFIARGVLGAWRSDALQREVTVLEASRGAAQNAEGHSLRRLERDIHDGPQQRLVRLQMDLAAAERQLDSDPDKARGLIAEAMQQSRDALEELRALSRGFAPPILLDRGLVAALESAAVRSAIPTRIVNELPEGFELPQEVERNAYFIASEALVNAGKHSEATDIEIRASLRDGWLDIVVTDDGHGGAAAVEGHGLAGLEERLRGLGGTLEVHSPEGGPTIVSAHVPFSGT
ncbi:MAG: sensor domain-containing protein [Salinibacterium sp.]|nr:sensor domain-containing protein [Salinibacterium sp.]